MDNIDLVRQDKDKILNTTYVNNVTCHVMPDERCLKTQRQYPEVCPNTTTYNWQITVLSAPKPRLQLGINLE